MTDSDATMSFDPLDRVIVVGASLAGLRAAETLRQHDVATSIVVVGDEVHRPYDRPPLSKKLLSGEWEPDRIHLRQPDVFDDLDVDWRLGNAATALDVHRRELALADGSVLGFDGLVIATGAHPRRLAGQDTFDHVHELRTLDDALALRNEIVGGGRRVVVIGAGFIGLEAAATAKMLGNDVVVLEGAAAPLIRGLGTEMGEAVADLHRAHGVEVRCGVFIEALAAEGVRLLGGEIVPADAIVVGIGVTPNTHWLEGSSVRLRDGVVCDANLNALDVSGHAIPGVFAAGDVARWPNGLFDEEMRVEHWTNAAEQGAHVAANLRRFAADEPFEPYEPLPFFWSDQFEHRIQFLGRAAPDDEVQVVAGSVADAKFLALYGREGRLHGALGVNAPRWVMPTRKLFLERASWDEAVAAAAGLDA
ncbi:MAG TPA: FAD-dependent oxidoreductase [Ilumatobacteraceae bacterium]|nr:FAD-dependent oxidoreductase [Ilumatobacteraceae bacterium]